jgi:hypothetical protein
MLDYPSTSELVDTAKQKLGITAPNNLMSDEQIRIVIAQIGYWARQSQLDLIAMIVVTAVEFPEFFTRYELAEPN